LLHVETAVTCPKCAATPFPKSVKFELMNACRTVEQGATIDQCGRNGGSLIIERLLVRIGDRGNRMRRTISFFAALLLVMTQEGLVSKASADGIAVVHRTNKVRPVAVYHAPDCRYGPCTLHRPVVCPDRYSCYSLYGAYGPYGGPSYWSRYTADGWRAAVIVRRR
jgi:hypothetical protein